MRKIIYFAVVILLIAVLTGCVSSTPLPDSAASNAFDQSVPVPQGRIVVGSKIDTEGALLGNMIMSLLRHKGFQVTDKTTFGPTSVVRKALLAGEIDIYPEYTGNGAFFFSEADSPVWKDAKGGYDRVKKLDREQNEVVWLQPSPANNTWGIAIPKTLSESKSIKSLTDFASYVNGGGTVKLIGSQEFVTSDAALPSFQKAYKFNLKQDQLIVVSSGDTAQTEKAAAQGTNGVNAAMAYGTDGGLAALGLVFLDDPLNVQPVYEPCPIVREEYYEKHTILSDILDPVFKSLDLKTLQELNAQIAVQGKTGLEVADDYLTSRKLK